MYRARRWRLLLGVVLFLLLAHTAGQLLNDTGRVRAMRFPVFRQIVSMASVTLPVAGTVTNFNPLIADGYGGKTGSDLAARGCLAFFTNVAVGGCPVTAVGVGQGQGGDTSGILAAAGNAAEQLVQSAAPTSGTSTLGAPGPGGAPMGAVG